MTNPIDNLVERGQDDMGHGDYGMPRGARNHRGWDVVAEPGTKIKAPITGKITKYGYMYRNAPHFRYVEISGYTYRFRLGYTLLKNVKVGDLVKEGNIIASLDNIAAHWGGGMKNHLHIECYKNGLLTDPEPLFLILNNCEK